MRELPTYRYELEEILKAFPNNKLLTITDVANYIGRSRAYVREKLEIHGDITTQALAHKLAEINHKHIKFTKL